MAVLSEPQFLPVNVSASGNTQLAAGVAGQKIRVVGLLLVAAGTVAVKFVSGAAPDLTGPMTLMTGKAVTAMPASAGHFETAAGAALTLNLGAAVQVSGALVYVLVAA